MTNNETARWLARSGQLIRLIPLGPGPAIPSQETAWLDQLVPLSR